MRSMMYKGKHPLPRKKIMGPWILLAAPCGHSLHKGFGTSVSWKPVKSRRKFESDTGPSETT